MDSYELVLCYKPQRVCLHRILPMSISKDKYLDDWKEHMIWEGGLKLTEINNTLTITFVSKDGKLFAKSELPQNIHEAVEKTKDSSRGYAIRMLRPDGNGYEWVGVVFRDRNDAFDFGVVINEHATKKSGSKKGKVEAAPVDFGFKQGTKIKVNLEGEQTEKKVQVTADYKDDPFWNFPSGDANKEESSKPVQEKPPTDNAFDFFNNIDTSKKKVRKTEAPKATVASKTSQNLIDLD